MPGIDSNCVLMCHCEGADASAVLTDSSSIGHSFTRVGNAQIDTAQYKFGSASALFDGSSDCFYAADHAAWDVFASAADNWTIDFWVKMAAHTATDDIFISQVTNLPDRWYIGHAHGAGLLVKLITGSADQISLSGGEIADNDWHHIALCKVAALYGIYLDGTQTAYVSDASTATFASPLVIGAGHTNGAYAPEAWMDEVRIYHENYFGAAPVVGLTNTIIVPTAAYTDATISKIDGIPYIGLSKAKGVAISAISKINGVTT